MQTQDPPRTSTGESPSTEISDPVKPPARRRRFLRWIRQGHVLFGISAWVKLLWFHGQLDSAMFPVLIWVVTTGTSILLVSWMPWVGVRTRAVVAILLNLVISVVMLANLLYFRFYASFLTFGLFSQVGQTGDVLASIWALFAWTDLWLFADIAVALVVLKRRGAHWLMAPATPLRSLRSRELSVFATALGLCLAVLTPVVQAQKGDAFKLWDTAAYQATGLLGFHIYDAYRTVSAQLNQRDISAADLAAVGERLGIDASGTSLRGAPAFGEFKGANVLIVQIESLESFPMGLVVGGDEVTPQLNDLAEKSVVFTDAHHQTSSGHTSDAEWLAGCSLHPARTGTAFSRFSANHTNCLPDILGVEGYSTAAHHANDQTFWNRSTMYPTLGYERFFHRKDYTGEELGIWGLGDIEFMAQTVAQLEERPKPFYDVAITLTNHHPYKVKEFSDRTHAGDLEDSMVGHYLDSVNYTDEAIGRLIDEMKQAGLWDDTVVVFYGDHNAGLDNPHDVHELLQEEEASDYEEVRMRSSVPMMVHLPQDRYSGFVVEHPVGQIDIPPMLMHLLGVPSQGSHVFLGSDPFRERVRPVALRNGGFVDERFLLASYQGPCFERATQREVSMESCLDLRALAAEDLRVSDFVAEHDLVPQFQSR